MATALLEAYQHWNMALFPAEFERGFYCDTITSGDAALDAQKKKSAKNKQKRQSKSQKIISPKVMAFDDAFVLELLYCTIFNREDEK